jgi:serine/threonine-protein kinase
MIQADSSARDDLLAELLDGLTNELRGGRQPDLEAVSRRHPELASELRELWAAVQLAEAVASHSGELLMEAAVGKPPAHMPASPEAAGRFPTRVGDYELSEELGRGGMGIVYRARQLSLGRTVALKLLLRGALSSAADVARFRGEAESAARLDHPLIVSVYEVGTHDEQPYFSMQYIEGTTLARLLADGPLEPLEAARLLAQVARAVQFAHDQGVLHRDLKPSNILIDGEGRPHITDFGLAKRIEAGMSLTRTGAILGTPSYMAPEQAAGNRGEIGPASDVYSLGTILYQMLTGRPPFQAASPVDTVLLVLEQDPLPPRLLNPKADRDLEMIALRCLQKPPGLRYPTAAALAEDLERYVAGEPISARSGAFSQVVARWFRETHHATVLENWGLLWMWHSLALLVICLLTNYLQWQAVQSPGPYLLLWTLGLGTWAAIFWALRHRTGPVTFVERQIAHVWAGSMITIALLYVVEIQLGLEVLKLSPVIALITGMTFIVKAGILTGAFYVQAAALFVTAGVMAFYPGIGISIFGLVAAACFFFPGLKYHRQRLAARRAAAHSSHIGLSGPGPAP